MDSPGASELRSLRRLRAPTLGGRLEQFNGIGPGFDHARVGLAIVILLWHSFGLSYGIDWTISPATAPIRPILATLLPMFFALSGFLVMGSAIRTNNVRTFITFRALRIMPALATEISLSALILGPVLTEYPLSRYFRDPKFLAYFGSLTGNVRYILPGMFIANPVQYLVNGALWTVGPEILCYVIAAALMTTSLFHRRGWMSAAFVAVVAFCLLSDLWDAQQIYEVLPRKILIVSFLAGNLLYLYRDRVTYRLVYFLAALATLVGGVMLSQQKIAFLPFAYLAGMASAYVITFIGLTRFPRLPFFHRGDYSYGLYIYGFPIQQTITYSLPGYRHWWFNFPISLLLALFFAVGSWHLIEKPVLSMRKRMIPTGSTRQGQLTAGPWTTKRVVMLICIFAYGLYVSEKSHVFPLRDMTRSMLGMKAASVDASPAPKF